MVLAQEKYRLPDPGLNGEGLAVSAVNKPGKQRLRKRKPPLKLNFGIQCCLASVVVGFIFMAGIALTLYYVLPARIGYQIVSLEKEIHELEQQQKLLEIEEAHARSLGRIESIATTQMAMLPMEDRKAAVAVANNGSNANLQPIGSNAGMNQVASSSTPPVASDSEVKKVAYAADSSPNPAAAGSQPIIQATARLVSAKFMTASRGVRAVPIED